MAMRRLIILLPALATFVIGPALAAPAAGTAQPGAGASRHIDCRCRANGRTYELGTRICLPTPAGHRVAECRMEQNVTSWRFAQEDCSLSAMLLTPAGASPLRR
jgi:hypothetical protein